MPLFSHRRRSARPVRIRHNRSTCSLVESLESRILLDGITTYDFGTLVAFNSDFDSSNGARPQGMILAPNGDIYGTTAQGGPLGYGTIFKIPHGTTNFTILASFGTTSGFFPTGNLVLDGDGNLFGTTINGGDFSDGTVFELKSGANAITILDSFNENFNGSHPAGGLSEQDGILYGVTFGNGSKSLPTVFSIDPSAPVIHTIARFADNDRPAGSLVFNADGDIFGTTTDGGANNDGSIFVIPHGTNKITNIFSFNSHNGFEPLGNLILADQGDNDISNDVFYGVTSGGGANSNGEIFKFTPGSTLTSTGTLNMLFSFNDSNGNRPTGGLVPDGLGNLIGATGLGGEHDDGTVFKFNLGSSKLEVLHSFTGRDGGRNPSSALVVDDDGNIIGGAVSDGPNESGILYELAANFSPRIPDNLQIVQQPVGISTDSSFIVTVAVRDVFGKISVGDSSTVTLAIQSGPAGAQFYNEDDNVLSDTLTATVTGGIATFDGPGPGHLGIGLTKAGTYTLVATDGTLKKSVSLSFTITAGSADHLAFANDPAYAFLNTTASAPIQVQIQDRFNNIVTSDTSSVTLALLTFPLGGTLTGNLTMKAANGVATFSTLKFSTAGNYSISAARSSLVTIDSDVVVGTATHLNFSVKPVSNTAGASLADFKVSLLTAGGAVDASNTSLVTLTITSGPSGAQFLTGPATHSTTITVAAVAGVATFSGVKFDTAGSGYVLTASATGISSVPSNSFTILPAASDHFIITTQPTSTSLNTSISPAVVLKIYDQFGNLATKDNSQVTLTGVGAGSPVFTQKASGGIVTFSNIKISVAGGYTLHATDGVITPIDTDPFTVGVAKKLVFLQTPGTTTAGNVLSTIKVAIEDINGKILTGDNSLVTLAITDGTKFFIGNSLTDPIQVNAVAGVATFTGLNIRNAGFHNLVATSGPLDPGFSNSFLINPAAPSQLIITQQPAAAVGTNTKMNTPIIVTLEDQFGNVATNNSSSVKLTVATGPAAALGSNSVSAKNGVATFTNFTVNTVGAYTLTVSNGNLPTVTTDSFDVVAAAKLVFTTQPPTAQVTAGDAIPVTISVQTSSGGATADLSAVTLALTDSDGIVTTLPITQNAVAGDAAFSFTVRTAGTYTLTATSPALATAVSRSFTVKAGAVDHLDFSQQPTRVVAGKTFSPTLAVAIEDQFGNVVKTANNSVTIAFNPPDIGVFGGTLTVNASSGIAKFSSLTVKSAGEWQLLATSGALTSATSNFFIVDPAAATHMTFSQQPTDNFGTEPRIALLDAFGNTVTNSTAVVTLQLVQPSNSTAKIGGVYVAPLFIGVADFTPTVDTSGTYNLRAISAGLPSLLSNSFVITII